MKKKLQIMCLSMVLLSVAIGVQAASVTWDVGTLGVSANYAIPLGGNGATFVYYSPSPPIYYTNNQASGGNQSSANLGTPAVSTTTEDFGSNPGSIELYALGGGATHADGVINQAVAQITQADINGSQYINGGTQHVQSNIQRSFSADPGSEVTVSADITGIINWVSDNWNWDPSYPLNSRVSYSGYQIAATVSLLPMSLSGAGISADIPDPILLDADNLSGSTSFFADADQDIFYRLIAGITIDTRVGNFDFSLGPLGALPDVGSIGTQGDPLLMTTTVSQTPVPGSILLLFSGLVGLLRISRRKK